LLGNHRLLDKCMGPGCASSRISLGCKSLMFAAAVIIFCLILVYCRGCTDKPQEYTGERFIMDTLVSVKVYSCDPQIGPRALQEAFDQFSRIANLTDRFAVKNMPDPEISDIYRVNKNAGIKPVIVSNDTLTMLEQSSYFADQCNGVFDVTIGPLMDLWGFGQNQYRIPSDQELQTSIALLGYKRIVIDKAARTVFLPEKGMEIDLGGIAKGYATDMAVSKLRKLGIKSAIINAGGSIYALGSKPDGSPWLAGIQDPRNKNRIIAVLKIRNCAVATTGDYERYFIKNGVRYHHILNPFTGQPARNVISTTVVASNATEADALSTMLFLLGPVAGMELIEEMPYTRAVFVDNLHRVIYTRELNRQIDFEDGGGYTIVPQ
jgi:thiamine biosynthesis lipoprotein